MVICFYSSNRNKDWFWSKYPFLSSVERISIVPSMCWDYHKWSLNDSFHHHLVILGDSSDFLSHCVPLMPRAWGRRGEHTEKKEKNLVVGNFRISCPSIYSCLSDINPRPGGLLALPTTHLPRYLQFTLLFAQIKLLPASFLLFSHFCLRFCTLILNCNSSMEYSFVYPHFLKLCVAELSLEKYIFYGT